MSLFHVGPLHPYNDGDFEIQFLSGGDHSVGENIAPQDAAKNIDENSFDFWVRTVLRGEHYLPLGETFDVLQQAAPEMIASVKERRAVSANSQRPSLLTVATGFELAKPFPNKKLRKKRGQEAEIRRSI